MVPDIADPIMPLFSCKIVHSLHKNFDTFFARSQNEDVRPEQPCET